jgi:uncharacterized membrane protein
MATQAEPGAAAAAAAAASPVWNRVIFLLSLVGVFVAGYLWWAHSVDADIPCSVGGGCGKLQSSPYSRFPFGSGPPVAAYGALAYLALAALAFARSLDPGNAGRDRRLLLLIVLLSGGGVLASLCLTYLALFVVRATCPWCLTSQCLILGIFSASLLDRLRPSVAAPR